MKLYFTNNTKKRKFLLETDYEEDIYDEIACFFEEHHFQPHFLEKVVEDGETRIRFESQTEYFIVEE